jgi:transcriptional repressor NrdR
MKCPKCGHLDTKVVDSREGIDGRSVRRRRECVQCEYRITTFERYEEMLPLVIKKDGQRQDFDRSKILLGLKKACEKRPVGIDAMEEVVRDIEGQLIESGEREIASGKIGEVVIEKLKNLDQVAYVRFASVYREFSDIKDFVRTLDQFPNDKS